jgi:CBS domain-containing membrane protein
MQTQTLSTVADVMTRKIVTVTERDVLENIEEQMHRLRFRHLPVIDDDGTLIGLVSHRDLLHASSSFLSDKETERNAIILKQPVGRIMQREVITVQPEDPLVEAGKLLWESKIGCLPVVDASGVLVGIITEADFVRIALHLLGSDVAKPDVEQLAARPG